MPIHCPRCREIFLSDALLLEHHRATVPCQVKDSPCLEGFDAAQQQLLKSRKKERRNMTEEDKWRKVYRILFPNDDHSKMPSPCKLTLMVSLISH
jgi:hypothetical protein